MDGKEAIIAKILSDAEASAASIVSGAESELNEMLAAAEESSARAEKANKAKLTAECDGIVARKVTLARLEAGKLFLAQKQAAIAKAYVLAQEKLLADDKRYASLMTQLVLAAVEDGDVITVGAEDKALDDKWFKSLAAKTKVKITMSQEKHSERGVILYGVSADKTLTVKAVMDELRERTEAKVAEILFGDNK